MNSVSLFLIELVIVLFLGYIAKRKAKKIGVKLREKAEEEPKIKKVKPDEIKAKKPFKIERIIIIAIYVIVFSVIGYLF